ncbi:efflux RND transporter periplasmic adaptor subunit (plasmid) [Azospirillum brasilense]|uniref:Efflux RND transporter periplasmic adaptor subunit n=1 Tax=Azospirillum brasilense TaxID=192 RepID=A0A4D8QQT4_AZOBR|nr:MULTISPECIES: efflux RND transporter periplasmic adaptor subunit [Azospirillum]MDW7555326.1 efflux RND transporter periplasmic adaptor subunit [Azospirillum brasilense]MDW7595266.1 efflux RND transporter periplasmic adaptor subunit [Azospirillum brasilense]MDW7630420.1 efflux RND transporter periplasmic adaptor subunit [Azospirillum brasilense]MDX5949787.1 efflux RND transporter periplasmic adaptor subunit [Azospirillum brasilense]OPH16912.1 hemolysin secretion protein D [Azospirillum brasi
MLRLRHGLAVSCLLVLLPSGAVLAQQPANAPPPTVTTEVVRDRDVTPTSEFIGRVQAIQDFEARARVEGFIEQVAFQEGQNITKDTLLYVIEQAPYQAAVDSAKADLARAQATLREAQRAFQRAQELRTRGNISQADVDQAQAGQETAEADIMQTQAKLRQAELNLGYTRISSPIDGRIGATAMTVGDLVNPSSGPLATVVQLDPIRVVFSVSDRDILEVQRAAPDLASADAVNRFVPALRLADGSEYEQKGKVSFASNRIDPQTGTIPVYADFANPKGFLLPGQYVTVLIRPAQTERQPVVPVSAIQQDQQGSYVLVLDQQNRAQRRPIEPGPQLDQVIAVPKGVQAGETVIVGGAQKVRPGMVVQPERVPQTAEQPRG